MILFTSYVTPSNEDIAEQLCEEPDDFANVLEAVVVMIDEEQTEELCSYLEPLRETAEHSRKFAAFLRRLADACDGGGQ